jgi:hypothetical protein
LERLDPFPNDANYQKMKTYIDDYAVALEKFKEELKSHALAAPPQLAPNEFQSRLRQAMTATIDKARANKVRLPDNFALGFDEFTAALPNEAAAPLLGQELSQIQMLLNILIEARVDGVSAFKRTPLPEEHGGTAGASPTPGRKPAGQSVSGSKTVERSIVDLTFTAAPVVMRKVIDQILSANEQLYIIRILHVKNEKQESPPREQAAQETSAPGEPVKPGALHFIVGNEHVDTMVKIEIVRFVF